MSIWTKLRVLKLKDNKLHYSYNTENIIELTVYFFHIKLLMLYKYPSGFKFHENLIKVQ